MQRTVVVTGGAGFIGRHICNHHLEQGDNVVCIDNLITGSERNIKDFANNEKFSFICHDVVDNMLEFVGNRIPENIHMIYHFACIASPPVYKKYPIETLNTSFIGTRNVLELARRTNAKVLFTSTSEVYGDPMVHPQPEEYFGNVNTVGERSCYDEGKRVAETLIYEYRRNYHLDLKIVRLFNTYGPYMDIDDGRVITNFIKMILENKPLQIYGDGTQGRSFCYIDDLVKGLVAMMDSGECGPINLGNPYNEFTLNELVGEFQEVIRRNVEVEYSAATENDPKQRKPDISKAKERLGWEPCITIKDGVKKTMQYFTDQTNTNRSP